MVHGKKHSKQLRIGIYAGAFDPVHTGHVTFALQALTAAGLDEVVFLPERRPRFKPGVEHYAHRVVMLKNALSPHPALAVMETVDRHTSVLRTLPQLRGLFPAATLVFLMGSDTALSMPDWHGVASLLASSELIVGVRSTHQHHQITARIGEWAQQPTNLTIIDSFAPDVSSDQVRQALRADRHTDGLLTSVRHYARQEWLYVSPGSIG